MVTRPNDISRLGFLLWMSDLVVLLALVCVRLALSRNGASTVAVTVLLAALLPLMWVSATRRHPTRIALAYTVLALSAWFLPWAPTRPMLGY